MRRHTPAVIIDNGTGYTKMGYAGNQTPQFVIPSTIAYPTSHSGSSHPSALYDFCIGEEAMALPQRTHALSSPIRHGLIENWDQMEAYWQHCFFKYLRCNPEEQPLLLTEPPLNPPENREYTAEVMFESFGVPALYIAVQAVMALAASWLDGSSRSGGTANPLTGTVVDSGDGVTHIIPVVDGYAIASAIKHVPVAGREITLFLQQLLRERPDLRDAGLTPEEIIQLAKRVKECHSYTCSDVAREWARLDQDPARIVQPVSFEGQNGQTRTVSVGAERFLGAEVFFSPEMVGGGSHQRPLPALIDDVIQASPIDCRRGLLANIVLSGGSTLFRDFGRRLQRDLQSMVETRLAYAHSLDAVNKSAEAIPVVNVLAHRNQRFAVWCGGSLLASMDQFASLCVSKAEYDETGPAVCRQSRVFGGLFI